MLPRPCNPLWHRTRRCVKLAVIPATEWPRKDQPTVVPPYRWHGETDCLVRPFASRKVALFFIENLTFDPRLAAAAVLVSLDGCCYIDARRLAEQPSAPTAPALPETGG